MKRVFIGLIVFILLILSVLALDFTPQGNVNLRGVYNITNASYVHAQFFTGDGSLLSNIAGTGNDSWNQSLTDTLYASISVTGDNVSWNETYANTIYINQSSEGNLNVNSTTWWATVSGFVSKWFYKSGNNLALNETQLNISMDDRIDFHGLINNFSYLTTYNETYAGHTEDNVSWNQSYAGNLYSEIKWGYNQSTATFNMYNTPWSSTYNTTYAGLINNASYLSTYNATYDGHTQDNASWNKSYADGLYSNTSYYEFECSSGDFVKNLTIDGGYTCDTPAGGGDISGVFTYDIYIFNGTASGSTTLAFNETKLNETIIDLAGGGDNSSWNQSLADGLYSNIQWDYNQTTPAIDYCIANLNETTWVENQNYVKNNTGWWILNFTKIFSLDWTNITITESQVSDLVHTTDTDTNASTICSGSTTYLDGEGNCDDISSVYMSASQDDWINEAGDNMTGNLNMTNNNITGLDYTKYTGGGYIYDNGTTLILGHS